MEEKNTENAAFADGKATKHGIIVNAQYIKDLSFENPGVPASLAASQERPNIALSVDIHVNALQANVFEIALHIAAEAKAGDKPLFLVDLTYGGVMTLQGIPEAEKEAVLLVYCPNLLFPYARRIIADATRDGGFPPLMIDPIDFLSLYERRRQEQTIGLEPSQQEAVN